jgi:hypothetical protein
MGLPHGFSRSWVTGLLFRVCHLLRPSGLTGSRLHRKSHPKLTGDDPAPATGDPWRIGLRLELSVSSVKPTGNRAWVPSSRSPSLSISRHLSHPISHLSLSLSIWISLFISPFSLGLYGSEHSGENKNEEIRIKKRRRQLAQQVVRFFFFFFSFFFSFFFTTWWLS